MKSFFNLDKFKRALAIFSKWKQNFSLKSDEY